VELTYLRLPVTMAMHRAKGTGFSKGLPTFPPDAALPLGVDPVADAHNHC
jgi:hypothetical protein